MIDIVQSSMAKVLTSNQEGTFGITNFSEQLRVAYENNCFEGLRSIKKCLTEIQTYFEEERGSSSIF